MHHKEIHISGRKSRSKEQTGTDRRKSRLAKKKAVSKTAQDRSQKQTDSKEILISFKMEEHQADKNLANFY